ncbi:TetR/AcrR family transcriptional regulator [Clostridium sp. YIM B02515]|uniref:TetR/AcrR family transcriptional regulator n=1 Tax=Clostridium rhizosphaerae TaxID=2803861 RepID=A0ABS1TDV1_9CLOT|nr:TetR/AcrR family transcriptional regulator [Clostridium rhizosphaerae]MBL4937545.1 TetR/AcrR family transcriptional regulator [Clostridium rhizosphaerae]
MGSNERKEKEKEIRKNDIISAAERIFFTKGYNYATMDDVAREAEYSKRTVYVYFDSKEQIYFEIMIRGYRLLMEMLKANMKKDKAHTAIEELSQMASTLYQFSNDYSEYFRAIMEYENSELDFQKSIPDHSKEECYALGEKILGYLMDALKKGIAEGSVRSDLNIKNTALTLWACIIGVFNTTKKKKYYIENYHGIKPEDLVSEAFNLMIRSIQN